MIHKLIILQNIDAKHLVPPFHYDVWVDAVYFGRFEGSVLNEMKEHKAEESFLLMKHKEKEMRKKGVHLSLKEFLGMLCQYPDFPTGA